MNFWKYSLFTFAGAGVWTAVLAWLGVKVGGQIENREMHKVTFWLLGFLVVVGALYYFFVHRHMIRSAKVTSESSVPQTPMKLPTSG